MHVFLTPKKSRSLRITVQKLRMRYGGEGLKPIAEMFFFTHGKKPKNWFIMAIKRNQQKMVYDCYDCVYDV